MADDNPHLPASDVLDLLDTHALRIREAVTPTPAAMRHLPATYIDAIHPYQPKRILTPLTRIIFITPTSRQQLVHLLHASQDACDLLHGICGDQAYDVAQALTWGTRFERLLRQQPLLHDMLTNTFMLPEYLAGYIHALDPASRDHQRAACNNPAWITNTKPLHSAMKAYLTIMGDDNP